MKSRSILPFLLLIGTTGVLLVRFSALSLAAEPLARVAVQSGGALLSIGRGISINDRGDIGFMGVTGQGHNVFCINGETGQQLALMNNVFALPATGAAPTQTFGEYVEVNNRREVLAQRQLNAVVQVVFPFGTITTAPVTYIERWPYHGNRSVPGRIGLPNSLFAMGDGGAGNAWALTTFLNPVTGRLYPSAFNQDGGFSAVMPNTAFNNVGQVACSVLRGGNWSIVTKPGGFLGAGTSNGVARPQLADTGHFTLRVSDDPSTAIYWFSYDYSTFEQVAHSGNGFGNKGVPGVDDGGTVMVFCADLSVAGAAQINANQPQRTPIGAGPGMFYSAMVGGSRIFKRLAGISGNGVRDPGESWTDHNNNKQVDVGEDQGIIGSFDYQSRACVNRIATRFNPNLDGVVGFGGSGYLAAFAGTDNDGKPTVFTVEFGAPAGDTAKPPAVFIRQGDKIEGLSGHPVEFHLHDAVNNAGRVACWTRTSTGVTAILTGPARPATHLHVLTHGFGNPSKLKLPFGGETGPIGFGAGFLEGWYTMQEQIESLPMKYGSPEKQAELEGGVVSYVANWPSTDGWLQAILSVVSTAFAPALKDQLLVYADNEMDRAALHAESAAEKIVDDLFSTGFLYQDSMPQIHLIGHSRGAAVNARVARLLHERGITPTQYTALDGYSTDWPALSGILGDLSIIRETANIPGMRRVNVRVDDGFDELAIRLVLDAMEAFDGYLASWLGLPVPVYADPVVEELKQFTFGWKAPDRAGFDNYVLGGGPAFPPLLPDPIEFTNHMNITAAYTFYDRTPGMRALMDGPLGFNILSTQPLPIPPEPTRRNSREAGPPPGVKDGDFDALGELAAETQGVSIPVGIDPMFETFLLAMKRPEFLLASSWDITGNVSLIPSGAGYAARLQQGTDTSMSQMVKFGGISGSVEFDLGLLTGAPGAVLEVLAGSERIGSIDLGTANSSHFAFSLFGIPAKVTRISFRLAGAAGGAAVVTIDNVEITRAIGSGYPSLQIARDKDTGKVALTLTGTPGRAFRVQSSPDLLNWTDIAQPMNFSGTEVIEDTPPAIATKRYYRVAW